MSPRKVICPACGATNSIARSIPGHAALVAHDIAGTVDQIEHFVGVGERDNQRGITPNAFVGKSHAAFALPESRCHRAVRNR